MKLQNNYAAVAFHQSKDFQQYFVESMMEKKLIEDIRLKYSEESVIERKNAMEQIASSNKNRLFYISKKVQEHADLIKFEKINLGWLRNLNEQHGTYILSKNEFYKFWVNKGTSVHITHFYPDLTYSGTIKEILGNKIPKKFMSISNLPVMKWDTFVVRLKEYPNGHMPVDPESNNTAKEFFVKLLMFIELSEIVYHEIKPNQKVNVSPTPGRNFDNKIKNETGVDVTFVTTGWNKILVVNGEFTVSGHLRIQPYGPMRSDYKLIWIEEYKKRGYIRRAIKDRDSENA